MAGANTNAHIPSVGHDGVVVSWITALQWVFGGAPSLLTAGYAKYKSRLFRVANLDHWVVLVSGRMIEELRKMPEDVASFLEAADDFMQSTYTHKRCLLENPFHVRVVQQQLTKHLPELCDAVFDEMAYSFAAEIPLSDGDLAGWHDVTVLPTIQNIIARVSTRVLVGPALARNPEYIKIAINFTLDVVIRARVINFFPNLLKPLAGRLSMLIPSVMDKGFSILEPVIAGQKLARNAPTLETEAMEPNCDLLNWLIDEAPPEDCSDRTIATLLMNLNLAAIYSTSMVCTHILYNLVSWPEYIEPIRAEISECTGRHGWTKLAFNDMVLLDSFMKESVRHNGGSAYSGIRKLKRPVRFEDGTDLPAGTFLAVAAAPTHLDEQLYPNSRTFDGYRFQKLRENSLDAGAQHSMVAVNNDFLVFGLGKHRQYFHPGRFFAVLEMKATLAYLLMHYDVVLPSQTRPKDRWVGESCIPDPNAR
ncbi:cytochrome P450 [Auricularia subglabra TFB-10046 SS5]|uniref:Cytochrome P450 n=1 Tax=Auricularia subglabra (strain TFB-10046 / SS5) TaxID=717982 RepID=J0LJX3_AURST|nr:cytochrome P450 [Auricularia subglabra TFB-10046 SS5]